MKRRLIIRCVPGFTWIQFCLMPQPWRRESWKRGEWWSVRGIAKTHSWGPFRVLTMRTDCLERAKRPGGEFYKPPSEPLSAPYSAEETVSRVSGAGSDGEGVTT